MTDHTEGRTPLTDEDLEQMRSRSTDPYFPYIGQMLKDVPRLLAEVDRLRAENAALAAKLEAVLDVITVKDPEWKPLTERYPEYFTPDTPEEAARKKGWKQGVDLLTQQIRAALGGDQDGGDRG
jgi:hypothetical protein